jgi:hypothetical protein
MLGLARDARYNAKCSEMKCFLSKGVLAAVTLSVLLAGCAGEADPCAAVNCAPGRDCLQGRCVPQICSFHSDCPAGTRCVGGGCQPGSQKDGGGAADGPSSDGAPSPDAAPPDAPGDLSPCGSCDDNDPCTTDHCAEGVCKHVTPIPTTCGNGTIDACEVCEGTKPLGTDQICFQCNQIGKKYLMYNKTYMEGNAYFSAVGGEFDLKITCNGKRVVTDFGGTCEQGSLIAKAGGKWQKSVTISCTSFAGHNKSEYTFLCGPAS